MMPIVVYGYATEEHRFSGHWFSGKSLEDAQASARFFFGQLAKQKDETVEYTPVFHDEQEPVDVMDVWSEGRKRHHG